MKVFLATCTYGTAVWKVTNRSFNISHKIGHSGTSWDEFDYILGNPIKDVQTFKVGQTLTVRVSKSLVSKVVQFFFLKAFPRLIPNVSDNSNLN